MSKEQIFQLKQEINKLLDDHPELIPLQTAINMRMKYAGSQENRFAILQIMMREKVNELATNLDLLKDSLGDLQFQLAKLTNKDVK